MSNENVVLEEILRRAMDDGLELTKKERLNDYEEGQLFTYFSMLDWAKQQAAILGIKFSDYELQAFDPYQLLTNRKNA